MSAYTRIYPEGTKECDRCHVVAAKRIYTVPMILRGDTKFDPHYSVGLGQVVKSAREVRAICKEKGLIEIGGEKPRAAPRNPRKPKWEDYASAAQSLGLAEEGREELGILKQELGQIKQGRKEDGKPKVAWSDPGLPPIKVDVTKARIGKP